MYDSNPRDPDDVHREYKDRLDAAESALDRGDHGRAADHYRAAADAREQLGQIQGVDYSTRVQELRRIADRAEKGDRIERVDNGASGGNNNSHHDHDEDDAGGGEGDDRRSEFREVIESFIIDTDTTWDDIGGLEDTKTELRQTIALGAVGQKPHAVQEAQSALLFGPPGTGKTLLAKAVANEMNATFFSVKLGSLLSKWYGESSQKITALFDVAKELSPSVIFLDEVDALTTSRGGSSDDASRRVLNTILSELSSLNNNESFTFVLANTNTPWDLDFAIRRRFPKRKLVPLPDVSACTKITCVHTTEGGVSFEGDPQAHVPSELRPKVSRASTVPEAIGQACHEQGYTGSDIAALAQRVTTRMVHRVNPGLADKADENLTALSDESLEVAPICPDETRAAINATSASLSQEDLTRFHEWDEQYGTG
ncbi:ATP-binding protein [Halorientalis salina]|uniref:ATP-binding protein n=1 Tax=Halorientalis salina TaxID=2932266 RepID=UPI0010AC166E|nr:ATP-binding protein [Halorientalis salina]